jgi:hypothetical protein
LIKQKRWLTLKSPGSAFLLQAGNFACDTGQKITGHSTSANIVRAPHPSYWLDLSPFDYWLFEFLKESMKGMELTTEYHIVEAITAIWRGATFEIMQLVFQEWMQRLTWGIDCNGEDSLE